MLDPVSPTTIGKRRQPLLLPPLPLLLLAPPLALLLLLLPPLPGEGPLGQ